MSATFAYLGLTEVDPDQEHFEEFKEFIDEEYEREYFKECED